MPGGLLVLQLVSAASHPGYDRITFQFTAFPAPSGVATIYTVSPATPPFAEDGSGRPVNVSGQGFLKVVFSPAYGRDPEQTTPRATYTGLKNLTPKLLTLVEAKETGDFEGYVTWVLGLTRASCWRVTVLSGPPRLVVDVPS